MFLDDLEGRALQSADSVVGNVGDWLDTAGADAVIRVGDKALGNQTAAEIAQGQAGGPKPVAPGQGNAASKNAMPYPTLPFIGAVSPVVLLALGVGIYLLMKKG